jgi:hypothetical protein
LSIFNLALVFLDVDLSFDTEDADSGLGVAMIRIVVQACKINKNEAGFLPQASAAFTEL